jgi:hypothetical protein
MLTLSRKVLEEKEVNFLVYNTGQQNLTFFVPRTSTGELSSTFMLNSDRYTEFFYQAEFQRYRGI